MHFHKYFKVFILSFLLSSCGGGGDGDGDSNDDEVIQTKTGAFIDSEVEGLSYSTASQSGLTNAAGEFKYQEGEVVTFKIGNVVLGAAFGAEYLTPLDITNSFLASDTAASSVARLLQTLDTDSNPENGITLPVAVASLSENLDVNDADAVEAAIGQLLISTTDAENHLNDSVTALPPRSVEDIYLRATIGSTGVSGCPNVVDAKITVSRNADGERLYDGSIDLSGGGQYLFSADDSTIRNPTVADDPNHIYRVNLNTYQGEIRIFTDAVPSQECAEVRLTTDTVVNLPPIVRAGTYVTTIPNCTSSTSTYNHTPSFWSYDKDGFIVNQIEAKFALDGGTLTTLVDQGDTTGCEVIAGPKTWNPGEPGNGGWYCGQSNPMLSDIPCTSGFSWEVSATDNEGLTTKITGSSNAPVSGGSTTGNYFQCSENYPTEACSILMSELLPNSTITSHAAGSCASLVPEPRTTISAGETPPSDLVNLIVNFDGFGLPVVSCLTTIDFN